MTANPLTDQILVSVASLHAEPLPPRARSDVAAFATRLTAGLPGIAPDVIGEVLLHVASVYVQFVTCDHTAGMSRDAAATVQILGEVGARLYLGDKRPVTS